MVKSDNLETSRIWWIHRPNWLLIFPIFIILDLVTWFIQELLLVLGRFYRATKLKDKFRELELSVYVSQANQDRYNYEDESNWNIINPTIKTNSITSTKKNIRRNSNESKMNGEENNILSKRKQPSSLDAKNITWPALASLTLAAVSYTHLTLPTIYSV